MQKQVVSFAVLAVVVASAKLMGWGPCPKHTVVDDFNLASYTGAWYEAFRVDGVPFEANLICVTANYTAMANGRVRVENAGVNCKTSKPSLAKGEAKFRGKKNVGKLGVKFAWWQPWGNYDVVATDYQTSLVYSCADFVLFHYGITWILVRDTNFNVTTVDAYKKLAVDVSISV